jgi:signal transduction histidine kinase
VEAQEVELSEAIGGVLPLIEKDAEQKKIKIEFQKQGEVFLNIDVEQFRRALLNLALNAIQASPANGTVSIGMRGFTRPELLSFLSEKGFAELLPQETEGLWAGVWVTDRGPGILPGNLKKLFTPFFTTKTEGFGLGLSITKKILESLGGSVSVANRPEGGALFLMILPAFEKKKEVEE